MQQQSPISPESVSTGLKRSDPREGSARWPRPPESQHFVEPTRVECRADLSARQNRFDLRTEIEIAAALRVEERSNPEAVTGDKYCLRITVIESERELPVESLKQTDAPLLVAVDENFRIGKRAKYVTALLQLTTEFGMIV